MFTPEDTHISKTLRKHYSLGKYPLGYVYQVIFGILFLMVTIRMNFFAESNHIIFGILLPVCFLYSIRTVKNIERLVRWVQTRHRIYVLISFLDEIYLNSTLSKYSNHKYSINLKKFNQLKNRIQDLGAYKDFDSWLPDHTARITGGKVSSLFSSDELDELEGFDPAYMNVQASKNWKMKYTAGLTNPDDGYPIDPPDENVLDNEGDVFLHPSRAANRYVKAVLLMHLRDYSGASSALKDAKEDFRYGIISSNDGEKLKYQTLFDLYYKNYRKPSYLPEDSKLVNIYGKKILLTSLMEYIEKNFEDDIILLEDHASNHHISRPTHKLFPKRHDIDGNGYF